MKERQRCAGQAFSGMRYYACRRPGKHDHEGKSYCSAHHPGKKAERDIARQSKWDAEDAALKKRILIEQREQAVIAAAEEWVYLPGPASERRFCDAMAALKDAVRSLREAKQS